MVVIDERGRAGIIHEDVEASPLTRDAVDHLHDFAVPGHVRLHGQGPPAKLADCRGGGFSIVPGSAVVDDHLRTVFGERQRDGAPDPCAATCDEGNAIRKRALISQDYTASCGLFLSACTFPRVPSAWPGML